MRTESPIGAVLVVGGGIAGIQASLDLAEAGFKVYLVESKSAIGGHMAQLDKTFPTNDCAMCIVSPKLVEAGRHLNIDILTNTELIRLSGGAGHFIATLCRKPRYIDVTKCTGCGDCERICPITLSDPYNEGLARRHAIYRLYPQAIPAAYAIEKHGISPCRNTCPANTSAHGYIALISQRRYAEALEVIKQYNPFPASVGRVCHHPCEAACTRGQLDAPLAICHLKRFVADHQAGEPVTPPERKYPEQVAVVGSGPAGLSAAHQLVRLGYGVTVFEALPVAGGMMRVGIPAYRLPREVLDREIEDILKEGVELRLNTTVHDINDLFRQGYQAIFLAVGAHQPQELGIPGERGTAGVHYGVAFLRQVSLGQPVKLGERVIVVGGGNTAIDAARTARRLGSREVTLLYRRTRAEMPAFSREVESGEAEGVRLELLSAPVEVLREDGRLKAVRCVRMRLGEPDASGRRRPIPIEGSDFIIEADSMIAAVAQAPEISLLAPGHGIEITRDGTFQVDPLTMATNRPGIFAGGDAALGPGTLIEAIASGRRGALSIHRYLRELPLRTPREEEPLPVVTLTREQTIERLVQRGARRDSRVAMPTLSPVERVGDFREVELGLTEEQAVAEAQRCLACGICAECYQCVKACQAGAVVHETVERVEEIEVGAVILAPGYEAYRAELSEEFGFGRYTNVVTSLQFERLLSASGPTGGHVERPSDQQRPRRIAFLQCIGSRDQKHDYCSAVCCMYATKQAIMAKEHEPDTEVRVFMMDMRAFGKGYEEYYHRAKKKYGIEYTRCRISAVKEDPQTKNLIIRYFIDDQLREEQFDLVVLSVGMEISAEVKRLGGDLGIELDDYGFCHTALFDPLQTSRPGIYVAGPFREPKDIPETVVEASGAAAVAGELLAPARGTLTRKIEYPSERDVSGEEPRIGVFVCHCGSNIAGFLDVPTVTEYAKSLPFVVHAEHNLYTCSQDSIAQITQQVKELNLNRVVVAACTPRTHEPLFQDSLRMAGLNPHLFEMANIRNQCSWVHSHDWEVATRKAKELVRMSVARAARLESLSKVDLPLQPGALVIGGGVAGMNAALALAEQGFPVHLVERAAELGGNLRCVFYTTNGRDPQAYLREIVARVESHLLITVHRQTELTEASGFIGNFVSKLRRADGESFTVPHGVIIVATGGQEYRGTEYGYGTDPRIITQQEFEGLLARSMNQRGSESTRQRGGEAVRQPVHSSLIDSLPSSVVMIQCVGPAERYCSRICCTTALKNALKLKELNSSAQVTVLFKDIRTYGFKERLYAQAREAGVLFVRYDDAHKPHVSRNMDHVEIKVWEPALGRELVLTANLLVLSTPIVPAEGARELATVLKVPVDLDGFFLEAHIKLRPVDFASDGIFMAGLSHYPKLLDETIVQAQAAAARAATILGKDKLSVGGVVAVVEAEKCTGCLTCVRVCPYHVPQIALTRLGVGGIVGAASIEVAQCQGCGICAAECPAKAIQLMHYKDEQMRVKVEALFAGSELVTA